MSAPDRIDAVAVRVCQTARVLASNRAEWVAIEQLHERLLLTGERGDSLRVIEAALAFAGAKGWLSFGPRPADAILLRDGAP